MCLFALPLPCGSMWARLLLRMGWRMHGRAAVRIGWVICSNVGVLCAHQASTICCQYVCSRGLRAVPRRHAEAVMTGTFCEDAWEALLQCLVCCYRLLTKLSVCSKTSRNGFGNLPCLHNPNIGQTFDGHSPLPVDASVQVMSFSYAEVFRCLKSPTKAAWDRFFPCPCCRSSIASVIKRQKLYRLPARKAVARKSHQEMCYYKREIPLECQG